MKCIEKSEFKIQFESGAHLYKLLLDDTDLVTPGGHSVQHQNKRLMIQIQSELEGEDYLNTQTISSYSLYSLWRDFFDQTDRSFSLDDVRKDLIRDSVLRCGIGFEKIKQFEKWDTLLLFLKEFKLEYPSLIQATNTDQVEAWIKTQSDDYKVSIDRLTKIMHQKINQLGLVQKAVLINSICVHGSIMYAYFLVTQKCTELEYSIAIIAGHRQLPNVFNDISRDDYKINLEELIRESHVFLSFIRCF